MTQLEAFAYNKLLTHVQPASQPVLLTGLGNVHASLGEYDPALNCHQKSLVLARSVGDRTTEEQALGNRRLGNGREVKALYNIGVNLASLEQIPAAGDVWQRGLALAAKLKLSALETAFVEGLAEIGLRPKRERAGNP